MSSFWSRIQSRHHIAFSCHVFPVSSGLWRFPSLSLSPSPWQSWEYQSGIDYNVPSLSLSDAFLMLRWGLWVFRKNTVEVKCPHHRVMFLWWLLILLQIPNAVAFSHQSQSRTHQIPLLSKVKPTTQGINGEFYQTFHAGRRGRGRRRKFCGI